LVTQPPPPPDDAWPRPDDPTLIRSHETVVDTPPPVRPPDRRIGAGMLLALGALALVAAGIAIAWYFSHRDDKKQTTTVVVTTQPATAAKVAVPRLVGLKEKDALVQLGKAGLRPKEIYRPTAKAQGVVVSQRPQEASEVRRGSQVTLVVDKGAANMSVPDLTGQSFADAQSKLDALGLDSTKTDVTSDQPAGTVVDQSPKAGEQTAKGSTVTLSVAKGQPGSPTTTSGATTTSSAPPPAPKNATVPDVQGQTEQAAVNALNGAGILPSLVFVPGSDPLGTVLQQAKPGGTSVPYHSHVQVNLSKGPNATTDVTVPNTVGQTLTEAVSTLNGAHLRLIYVRFPVTARTQAGKIVQQSPLQNAKAPQNAQILVFLGAYTTG
jgi:eukaryotic-like serine/threonine-protein kinase